MESHETLAQPKPGDSKPIGAVPFEVVRQAEFVFEPFMGSLVQLPAVRMQRAQSSEFFLAGSGGQPGKADVEEPLVWERPRPLTQSSEPSIALAEETLPAISPASRKGKNKKTAKEQEGPRFYQPPIVRFFDPLAATAEDGEGAGEPELAGPRESTQLSPELKAAILRIDEQRRQMQQDEKQEKPSGKKKRGFLAGKPAARDDAHDVPMEIVKPRDVVLTERAARWEEIAAPPPRRAEPAVLAEPQVEDSEVHSSAAEAGPPPVMTAPAPAGTEQVATVSAIESTVELPQMPATVSAHIVGSAAESVPAQEEIPRHAPFPPPHAAQPQETIASSAPEAVAAEEIVSEKEFASDREDLNAPEIPLHEASSRLDAIPTEALAPPPITAQLEETISAAEEDFVTEEIVSTLQFDLSDEDLREPGLDAMPQAALPPAPAPATPPFIAPTVEPETVSLRPTAPVRETAPLPLAAAADASTTARVEGKPGESPSTKLFRGIAAAIARGKRAEPVMEPVEPAIPQTPLEEPLEEETERSRWKKEKLPLATRLQLWLSGDARLDGNRRRADRKTMPGLVAFYWSGGSPKPHEILNISRTGFYLKTKELWSIETLVRMTLQRPPSETRPKAESISVLARVVRIDEDGVGHEFVTTEALKHARSMDVMPSEGTDTRELDRFLHIQ